jgi:hypothetical protein
MSSTEVSRTADNFIEEAQTVNKLILEPLAEPTSNSWLSQKDAFVFLVSIDWFNRWKEKVGFDIVSGGGTLSADNIKIEIELPQMNLDLIDLEKTESIAKVGGGFKNLSYLDVVVKDDATEGEEFKYVSGRLWDFIKSKYPNAIEIKRQVYRNSHNEICYQIHLPIVRIGLIRSQCTALLKAPLETLESRRLNLPSFSCSSQEA